MSNILFCRYYNNESKLIEITMEEIEELIEFEANREAIAEYVYQRIYGRFLKIFFYKSLYTSETEIFNKEFKNGFLIMASCCLVIESMASYLDGSDRTKRREGKTKFNCVFKKAKQYENPLFDFFDREIYQSIRNGILHQGETYNRFRITRSGQLIESNKINATKFCIALHDFLLCYTAELKNKETLWDASLWSMCRKKIRHIVNNNK